MAKTLVWPKIILNFHISHADLNSELQLKHFFSLFFPCFFFFSPKLREKYHCNWKLLCQYQNYTLQNLSLRVGYGFFYFLIYTEGTLTPTSSLLPQSSYVWTPNLRVTTASSGPLAQITAFHSQQDGNGPPSLGFERKTPTGVTTNSAMRDP